MTTVAVLDRIAINVKSRRLSGQLLEQNPRLTEIERAELFDRRVAVSVKMRPLAAWVDQPDGIEQRLELASHKDSFEGARLRLQ